MSKIMALIDRLKAALKTSWQDYPEALFFAYLVGLLAIIRVHQDIEHIFGLPVDNIQFSLLTAVPLFLVVVAVCERFALSRKKRIIGDVVALLLIGLIYFSLPAELSATELFRIFVYNVSFYLLFSLSPFYKADDKYDIGVIKMIARAAITLLYSIVLMLGTFAILGTIDYLLGITVDGEIYADIAIIVFAGFAPTFFLGEMPNRYSVVDLQVDRLIKKLHIYVIMPLLLIYSAILYLYFAKIIFVRQLPQNIIVNLTLWYSLITILTIFFTRSYHEQFALGRWFYKWAPRILILPLAMMLFSLYLRIGQYGFTVKRYFVLALALWLAGVVIYFVIRQKRNFQYIVIVAIIIMIISLDAPINAFTISFNSQYNRLTTILQKNEMLVNGKLIANADIAETEQEKICDLVEYFDDQKQIDKIDFLPADFNMYDDMQAQFGFEYLGYYNYGENIDYVSHYYGSIIDESIVDYNSFFLVELQKYKLTDRENDPILLVDDDYNLIVNRTGKQQLIIPLEETLLKIKNKQADYNQEQPLVIEQLPDYRFIISEISALYNEKDKIFQIDSLSGYLFIK